MTTHGASVFQILGHHHWRVWWHVNDTFDNDVEIQVATTTYQVTKCRC